MVRIFFCFEYFINKLGLQKALDMHKADMIAAWLKDDKVECSLELGDLIPDKKMVQAAMELSTNYYPTTRLYQCMCERRLRIE